MHAYSLLMISRMHGRYLVIEQQASPFKGMVDGWLARTSSSCLLLLFVWSCFAQLDTLAAEVAGQGIMMGLTSLRMPTLLRDTITLGTVVATLIVCGVILTGQLIERQREYARLKRASKARRLRYAKDGEEVLPPKLGNDRYHLFLSHVWSTGQDQMRILKQRLLQLMPDVKIYLDLDDLKQGKGAEGVDSSDVVLVFITRDYFASVNCVRELLRAVYLNRPLVALFESTEMHGRMLREEVTSELNDLPFKVQNMWHKLHTECLGWEGFEIPAGETFTDMLFKKDAIEWIRVECFQDVSCRLIADRLLPNLGKGEIYVQDEMVIQKRPTLLLPESAAGKSFHLYCSMYNAGARQIAEEMAETLGIELATSADTAAMRKSVWARQKESNKPSRPNSDKLYVCSEKEHLTKCEFLLIYLNARTWTSGEDTAKFAIEVAEAIDKGVPLLLAHESVSVCDIDYGGCDFDIFFPHGRRKRFPGEEPVKSTPEELLERNVYDSIATPRTARSPRAGETRGG